MNPEFTQLLQQVQAGDRPAAEELFLKVYDQLRRLASRQLSSEQQALTLQPTALVHEAYLRLLGPEVRLTNWDHRGHFYAAAAEAMRRILTEQARRRRRIKHGGGQIVGSLPMDVAEPSLPNPEQQAQQDEELLSLDRALTDFASQEPRKAELVKLRYFAGLTESEAAEALGISRATAARWWMFSRAWLYSQLHPDSSQTDAWRASSPLK